MIGIEEFLQERLTALTAKDRPDRFVNNETAALIVDTRDHLSFMRDMAVGSVVEIGVGQGNSTVALLLGVTEEGGRLYSIDIDGTCANVLPANNHWTFIQGDSHDFSSIAPQLPAKIDVLFVDGDHTQAGVKSDLDNYGSLVKPGGIIMVHDVLHQHFMGVRSAFEQYVAETHPSASLIKEGSWGLGIINP